MNYLSLRKPIEDDCIEDNKLIKSGPKLLNELLFKGKWRLLLSGEDIILIDNKNPRYFILGTSESLKMLYSSTHMFVDRTFKSSPSPLTQLHSIHIELSVLNNTLSVLCALLPKIKTRLHIPHSLTTYVVYVLNMVI